MALTKEQKKNIVEKLKENIAKQKAMVFVSVAGLKASELFDLRKRLKEQKCKLVVAKKTLLNLAFAKQGAKLLQGQLALIFSFEDELIGAKLAYNFSRENENLKILGGFFENKFRNAEEIISLGQIPSKQELLAKLVSGISAPVSGFTNALQAPLEACLSIIKSLGVNKI